MDETLMTYALWGRGAVTPENAKALLEGYIPDNVGTVYWPGHADREHKGLRTALDWFEDPEFLGPGGAVPTTDIIASLVYEREGPWEEDRQGDEVCLLALWPEDPTHEEFDFIEAVQAAGITVFDLSRALDELDLSLYSRPEPTKEEKAEARAAAKAAKTEGGTRGRTSTTKLSDLSEEEGQARETQAFQEVVTKPTQGALAEEAEEAAEVSFPALRVNDDPAAVMFAGIKNYIDAMVREAVTLALATTPELVETTDRPPFDGPYVGEGTTAYFWRKSANTYRLADGKPRRGEQLVNLTPEEEAEKGLK